MTTVFAYLNHIYRREHPQTFGYTNILSMPCPYQVIHLGDLPWDKQKVIEDTEVHEVAEIFIQANCYQPPVPGIGIREG
ncbi:hypothetical protein NIES37_33970 [Tolypothrix tenuis PCC 7101]|uniref:Uncharacterized protein n=1 Tax=Tolypothrix tenuis PCC 7101 TaxID=231146 RepID=A0A1Z4N125_9CYAN|nr:hypothetical protein [Aulosira sp. FACHB-113]BAY99415.1 hypothetical protein NIES37_33970 [Tolypothrix tenuis PCC 7101]BAZ76664.1 hypothetical protein NIES50_52630 [Aulosira laxa NIES-50]